MAEPEKPKINVAALAKRRSTLIPPPVKAQESNARVNAARASIIAQVQNPNVQRRLSSVPKPREGLSKTIARGYVQDQRDEEVSLDANMALMKSLQDVKEEPRETKKVEAFSENTKKDVIKDVANPMHAFKLKEPKSARGSSADGNEFLRRTSVMLSLKTKSRGSLVPPPTKSQGNETLKRMSLISSLNSSKGRKSLIPLPPSQEVSREDQRRASLLQDYVKEKQEEDASLEMNKSLAQQMRDSIAANTVAEEEEPHRDGNDQKLNVALLKDIKKPLRRVSLTPVSTRGETAVKRMSLLGELKKPKNLVPLPPTEE